MKYTRKKIVETVLFDGYIDDLVEVKSILESLHKREIDVDIKIKDMFLVYTNSRITGVSDKTFSFLFVGKSSIIKSELIENIQHLNVVTNDQILAKTKPGISRWHLINPAEDI